MPGADPIAVSLKFGESGIESCFIQRARTFVRIRQNHRQPYEGWNTAILVASVEGHAVVYKNNCNIAGQIRNKYGSWPRIPPGSQENTPFDSAKCLFVSTWEAYDYATPSIFESCGIVSGMELSFILNMCK